MKSSRDEDASQKHACKLRKSSRKIELSGFSLSMGAKE